MRQREKHAEAAVAVGQAHHLEALAVQVGKLRPLVHHRHADAGAVRAAEGLAARLRRVEAVGPLPLEVEGVEEVEHIEWTDAFDHLVDLAAGVGTHPGVHRPHRRFVEGQLGDLGVVELPRAVEEVGPEGEALLCPERVGQRQLDPAVAGARQRVQPLLVAAVGLLKSHPLEPQHLCHLRGGLARRAVVGHCQSEGGAGGRDEEVAVGRLGDQPPVEIEAEAGVGVDEALVELDRLPGLVLGANDLAAARRDQEQQGGGKPTVNACSHRHLVVER